MKTKIFICILFILCIKPSAYGLQAVIDSTNLIQNIEHTLRTIHIESSTMTRIAQEAKALGNDVQMIMTLHNQLLLAKQNIENVAALIREGKYKSIKELNQMCYAVQRVGRSVDGIGRTFKRLFPDSYKLIREEEKNKILKEQEEEIDSASDDALAVQDYLKDETENEKVDQDINAIMNRIKTVIGVKGALQLQSQLLTVLLNENRKLNTLLATSQQVNTLKSKNEMSKQKARRKEHQDFMKDWGNAKSKKKVLSTFP